MWFINEKGDGYVANSRAPEGTRTLERSWSEFIPIGEGNFAWAKPNERDELYLAAETGALTALASLIGHRRIDHYAVAPGRPAQLWVVSEGCCDLYRIDCVDGSPRVVAHLSAPEPLGQIATDDGMRFWTWSKTGLRLASIEHNTVAIRTLDKTAAHILRVDPIQGTQMAVVRADDSTVEIWDATGRIGRFDQIFADPRLTTFPPYMAMPPWLNRYSEHYEVFPQTPLTRATLSFAGARLTTDRKPPASLGAGEQFPGFVVTLIDRTGKPITTGTVRLVFRPRDGKEDAKPPINLEDVQNGALPLNTSVRINEPYDIVLEYAAKDSTSAAVVTWHDVRFAAPLLERKSVRTAIAYGVIVLVALLLLALPVPMRVRGWLPALTLAGSATGIWTSSAVSMIDAPLLAVLLVATIIAATASGLISPSLYRTLAKMEPLRSLSGVALLWRPVRRRLLTPYAELIGQQVRLTRRDANDEIYVPIPAVFTAPEGKSVEAQPADVLARRLSARTDPAPHALVEAPGGRGKSALFNRTIELLLEAFRRDPASPLPILCREAAATLEDSATATLGKFAVSRDVVDAQLAAGKLILAVDGLTESPFTPQIVGAFLTSATADNAPLLATSRPNDEYRKAFEPLPSAILVEPQRLDESTLREFERAYLAAKSDLPRRPLTETTRRICRTADGGYLPILVRLAMISETDVDDVPALYDEVCASLLRRAGEPDRATIDRAAKLCTDTYWYDGVRTLYLQRADKETAEILTTLLKASIVVPVGPPRPRDNDTPAEVRFFHDSMQTYLTARGLAQKERTLWPRFFFEAAADLRFREASASSWAAPEIFEMCVQGLGTREAVEKLLARELEAWATEHREDLPMTAIRYATPEEPRQQLPDAPTGPVELLFAAVKACQESSDPRRSLATLFAALAPLVMAATQTRQRPTAA